VKVAVLFPGQGSQYVGMGKEICEAYPEAAAIFNRADEILGFPLSKLCFEGPEGELTDTVNTQPAVFTTSLALWEALQNRWSGDEVSFVAGHSLGEYTALVASGALSFEDGLRLVRERGRLMKEAGLQNPGGMVAVIGLDPKVLEEICQLVAERTGKCIRIANYNSPQQFVIAGHKEALEEAATLAKEKGARRVIPLAVAGAFHTELMNSAREGMRKALSSVRFRPPKVPLIANTTAKPVTEPEEIRDELLRQLESPVLWVDSVNLMAREGVDTFIEVGPKKVLTGLVKRTCRGVKLVGIENPRELEEFVNSL